MPSHISETTWYSWLSNQLLLVTTITGVLIGILAGTLLRPLTLCDVTIMVISYPGELFMRLLKLMVLPFIISSLIMGTATLNVRRHGRIATRVMIYIVSTSALNVILGIVLSLLMRPGQGDLRAGLAPPSGSSHATLVDTFMDMGRNIITDNVFQSAFEQTLTEYYDPDKQEHSVKNNSYISNRTLHRRLTFRNGTNILGIIFFCAFFGTILGDIGPQNAVIIKFFSVINEVITKMLMAAIWVTPIGVSSVICGKILSVENIGLTLSQLSWFIATNAIGVLINQLLFLQTIYYILVRKNPYKFYANFGSAIVTSIATASKAAAFPLTLNLMDNKLKVDKRISRFVMSINNINMDGTALFLSVSVCFLSQINHIPFTIGNIICIGLSCTVMSMSSVPVPSAAIMLVIILCSVINTPHEDVSLLLAVDWLADRIRTPNNLLADCYCCAVVESLSKTELAEIRIEENNEGDTKADHESLHLIDFKNGQINKGS